MNFVPASCHRVAEMKWDTFLWERGRDLLHHQALPLLNQRRFEVTEGKLLAAHYKHFIIHFHDLY